MTDDEMRAEFEAAAAKIGAYLGRYETGPYLGEYKELDTDTYWFYWQAAVASRPAAGERGDLWIKMRRVFVDRAEQYQKADRYEMCSAIADAAARELVDLAAPQPKLEG